MPFFLRAKQGLKLDRSALTEPWHLSVDKKIKNKKHCTPLRLKSLAGGERHLCNPKHTHAIEAMDSLAVPFLRRPLDARANIQ